MTAFLLGRTQIHRVPGGAQERPLSGQPEILSGFPFPISNKIDGLIIVYHEACAKLSWYTCKFLWNESA